MKVQEEVEKRLEDFCEEGFSGGKSVKPEGVEKGSRDTNLDQ